MAVARPTRSASAPRPPSTRRWSSTSATTSGSSSRTSQVTDDGADGRDLREHPRRRTRTRRTSAATSSSATFNVLNYFPTTGEEFVASGLRHAAPTSPTATATRSRTTRATPTVRAAPPNADEPRSASRPRSSPRSTRLDADIVSLEEIENSVKFGKDRDDAITPARRTRSTPTPAPAPGPSSPTPPEADRPPVAEQDVIRTGFIYKPAAVELGRASPGSWSDEANFDNAREPLAQAFKAAGGAGRRRVRGHRQPLQVQGRRGCRRPATTASGLGASTPTGSARPTRLAAFADAVRRRPRHRGGLPRR